MLLLIKAQGSPSPESVDCQQLCKSIHLIFLSFNPYVLSIRGGGRSHTHQFMGDGQSEAPLLEH